MEYPLLSCCIRPEDRINEKLDYFFKCNYFSFFFSPYCYKKKDISHYNEINFKNDQINASDYCLACIKWSPKWYILYVVWIYFDRTFYAFKLEEKIINLLERAPVTFLLLNFSILWFSTFYTNAFDFCSVPNGMNIFLDTQKRLFPLLQIWTKLRPQINPQQLIKTDPLTQFIANLENCISLFRVSRIGFSRSVHSVRGEKVTPHNIWYQFFSGWSSHVRYLVFNLVRTVEGKEEEKRKTFNNPKNHALWIGGKR